MPFVEVENGRLYYEISGKGRWLVLIHGAWASHEWWRWQVPELSQTYKVLSLDVRGHGQSSKLERPYHVDGFTRDLEALFQEVGVDEVALVGWSMGGIISMQYYLNYPSKVKALVLIATRAHRNPKLKLRMRLRYIQTRLNLIVNSILDFKGYSSFTYEGQLRREVKSMLSPATPREVVDWVIADLINNPRESFFEVAKSFWDWEAGDRLTMVRVPTLIMVGEKDTRTPPRFSHLIHEKIPGARLAIIQNHGHCLPQECPQIVNAEIISFLKDASY
ncbi:MAG: alpha/beta hydrolase [Dehalococcoidales bacterium]|nr:alpha/beta hydrolase [Dehalococcoidales bacterium]